jgi:putative pyrroloquinoline-quinone binding quinoprotein
LPSDFSRLSFYATVVSAYAVTLERKSHLKDGGDMRYARYCAGLMLAATVAAGCGGSNGGNHDGGGTGGNGDGGGVGGGGGGGGGGSGGGGGGGGDGTGGGGGGGGTGGGGGGGGIGGGGGGGGTGGGGGGGGGSATTMDLATGDPSDGGVTVPDDQGVPTNPPYDWLQFGGSAQHLSNNSAETTLTASNVSGLKQLFQKTVPSFSDGAPVLLTSVAAGGSTRDLLFVTTRNGDIVAVDAHTGVIVWQKAHGPGTCKITHNGGGVCYTTASPAIDPNRSFVYSYGLDGYVHKHAIADGAEVTTGGWPELTTTKGFDEKSASALAFATAKNGHTYLYVSTGGYPGDQGDYQGHLTAIDLASGSQQVFNTLCSSNTSHFVTTPGMPDCANLQSAVWARAGAIYEPTLDRLFVATGNGDFDPTKGAWADSILAMNPDGTGNAGPIDSYTPTTFKALQTADNDLGSTAPLILPAIANSKVAHVALQGGKDAKLRLVNLADLSGQGAIAKTGGELAQIDIPQGGRMLTAPALWIDGSGTPWVFVATGSGLSAVTITANAAGTLAINTRWKHTASRNSPIVANGVVYAAANKLIEALDPTTGNTLWSDTTSGALHWQSPVVINGVVYLADSDSHLTAWALP